MLIRIIIKIVVVLVLIISPVYLFAHGSGYPVEDTVEDPVEDAVEDPGGDPGVPFDGGASIAISAVAIFAIKKYRVERNKKASNYETICLYSKHTKVEFCHHRTKLNFK